MWEPWQSTATNLADHCHRLAHTCHRHAEAQRRLDRIQPLQEILASIRDIEGARLASWGIDHQGIFQGWVWLTGQRPPSGAAAQIADSHTDVEIRTGAGHTLTELLAAQTGLFQDIGPVGQDIENPGTTAKIRPIVVYTDIDMTANRVVIGIDPALADLPPHPSRRMQSLV